MTASTNPGTDLAWLGIAEAAELLRAKKLSPVELTRALLARIERLQPRLAAFITVTGETALAQARAAEAEIAAGRWRGRLHGVPVGLKDIIDVAGVGTTAHSKVLAGNVATADAEVTARLKAAGAVIVGKLATHEFALGGPSFDLPWPPAVSPWGLTGGERRLPGGSSSGSGVALAAGLVPAALGTDTGGSIRNPATMCGIVGLKPTYGRVSRRGVFPLSWSLDHVGPMTRGVADNALLLQVLAGHDAGDTASAEQAVPDFAAGLEQGVKGVRVGLVRHFHERDEIADPAVAGGFDTVADGLRRLGAEVIDLALPPLAEYAACGRLILAAEAFAVHRSWLASRAGDYGQLCRERLLAGAAITAADYIDAQRFRARLIAQTQVAFADIDVALAVSSFDPPCCIDDAETVARTYPRQARQPFNVTGQPALAIPAGFTADGLPLGVQLIGHPFQEAMLYRVARAWEREIRWGERRPAGM